MVQNYKRRATREYRDHKDPRVCVWFCHACGVGGGMSTMIEHCPECQHERCAECLAQWAPSSGAIVVSTAQGSTLSLNEDSEKFKTHIDLDGSKLVSRSSVVPYPTLLCSTLDLNSRYPIRATNCETHITSIEAGKSYSPPTILPALSPESASTSPSSPDPVETQTPRSSTCLSTATPRSYGASPVYSGGENDTEIGESCDYEDAVSDDSSEEDNDKDGSECLSQVYSPDTMRTLESRFLSLFNRGPHDVPDLIARFQDLMQFELGVRTATNSSSETPSSGGGTFDYGSIESSSMTTPSNSMASSRSPHLKRGRKKDDEDQKRRRTRRKQLPDRDILHFACPFRKKDPSKYGSLIDERFSSCLAPKIPELRRITYHLESTHRTPQCAICYSLFTDERGLIDHKKQEPCSQQAPALKEGINSDEWASIKDLLKAKKTKSESEKLEYEKGKWFEIFKLLFPHVDLPENPWNELYMPPSKASVTVDHILGSFERHVEEQIGSNHLERNSDVHRGIQNLLASFRQYQENLGTPRENFSLDSPESHFPHSSEGPPSNSAHRVEPGARQMSQASFIPSQSYQPLMNSPESRPTSEDFSRRSHIDGPPQAEFTGQQIDSTWSQQPSANIFSDMVFDFEALPENELFPANLMFNDYDMQFPGDLEADNHFFQLDEQVLIPPLPDIIASENDGTPESFIEQRLKNKHHGNTLLPRP